MVFLEFEKPLETLYQQLETLQDVGEQAGLDVEKMTAEIEKKIVSERKKIYADLSDWNRVQLSRHPERPYTLDYIRNICDSFIELHGDRKYGDDKAIVAGIASIGDLRLAIIGHQKGSNTKLRKYRNFGMAQPEGYRKALRVMKLAEKFRLPILNLIDTPGAYPGIEAEERGQAEAIARNLFEMAQLKTPILCYIIGEGASGGAIGIGLGDQVCMLENTWYSVISPESCSSILWRSWDYKEQAAEALNLTAEDMFGFGLVDGIVREPLGGAHVDPEAVYVTLKEHILDKMSELQEIDTESLLRSRVDKYSKMGRFEELSQMALEEE